jgi:hypothetical protein
MKTPVLLFLLLAAAGCEKQNGPELCAAAGGTCVLGGHVCPNRGPQDCNPDQNPGGAFCCLPCPDGGRASDAGTACE